VDHSQWLYRPLPQLYLDYASADVALIHALYDRFTQLRYITSVLSSQSELYITTWKYHQPASDEAHLCHPLLPLGVLNSPDAQFSTISCTICNRELAGTAFPTLSRDIISERRCWVCRAVAARNNNNTRRQYNLEGYFDYDNPPLSSKDTDFLPYE
jgi:exonuclease 3'-5' domain-containing protein 1